ncbi:uncharacterized protein LOC130228525 [Danio aesculapii]|uniref:uncharacterized protein LOC130228525 n=1 Tax=Danio aesculapii TaxID=1142201 RepID=UPI0024C062A5|nr:uncharacterized protein LOC130228525 [Danio aesculapii]
MKLSIVTLIALSCIYWTVCGKLVELVVKPGDNATLHCDRENFGQDIQWFKICSFQIQPLLVISAYNSLTEPIPRFHVLSNNRPTSNSYDLLIKNITEADLCLYYCSSEVEKIMDENGKISEKKVYHNGDMFTKLTFTTPVLTSDSPQESVRDCWHYRLMLLTLCPLSSLLFAILALCVYICCCKTVVKEPEGHQSSSDMQRQLNPEQDASTEIYYASLNHPKRGGKHPQAKKQKINRLQSSDFSVYDGIRMQN